MPSTLTPPNPSILDRPLTARERQIIEDISRREFIIGGMTLTALVAAGCGDTTDDVTTSAETRRVADMYGEVTVPVDPQRIVCTYDDVLGCAIALDLPIIAGPGERGSSTNAFPAFLSPDQTFGIEKIQTIPEPNAELVASLRPDLILNTSPSPEYIELYGDVAPLFTYDVYGSAGWRAGFEMLAATFGRAELASQWLAAIDARAAELEAALRTETPRSFALGSPTEDGGVGVWLVQPAYATMIDLVGFVEAPFVAGRRGEDVMISAELVPTIDADVFMFIDFSPEDPQRREALVNSSLWPQDITTFTVTSAEMYPAPQAFLALFDSVERALA